MRQRMEPRDLSSAFRALFPQHPPSQTAIVFADKGAPRGLGAHRPPSFTPVLDGGCFRRNRRRERHGATMLESVLQIVGDIGRRVSAVPEIDAPFAGAAAITVGLR